MKICRQPRRRGRIAALGTSLVAAAAIAGCGGSGPAAGTGAGAEAGADQKTIRVTLQPIADFAPIWLGISKGFFSKEGVSVQVVPGAASSSAQIPLLLSGQAEIASTTSTAALQAVSQNVEVSVVAGLTSFADTPERDSSALVLAGDSTVNSYADLAGKTVALSGLKSITQTAVMGAVEKAGGDAAAVKFIQVPLPNIGNTVTTGGADAGVLIDPFLSAATGSGAKVLGHPISEITGGLPGTSLVATKAYADANGPALKKFTAGLAASVAYCNQHPEEVITATAEGTKVDVAKLTGSKNPVFDASVTPDLLAKEADLLRKYGALNKAVDAASILWKG